MEPEEGKPCQTEGLLSANSLHNLTMRMRDNSTAHAEFRSRAFGRASATVYPNCSSADPAIGRRCRMIDSIANSAPSEYALCLLNWDCANDGMGRGDLCTDGKLGTSTTATSDLWAQQYKAHAMAVLSQVVGIPHSNIKYKVHICDHKYILIKCI